MNRERELLFLATDFGLAMVAIRIYFSAELTFAFLVWNLFLAWIPWGISYLMERKASLSLWLMIPMLGTWLLFLPNAPYILTDLFHLRPRNHIPQWYDLTLLLCFAWTGLWLMLSSLRQIHGVLQRFVSNRMAFGLIMGILLLTSFGVYLGRFQRWNSWDLMTQPFALFQDIFGLVGSPSLGIVGFTLFFGLFLLITYVAYTQRSSE